MAKGDKTNDGWENSINCCTCDLEAIKGWLNFLVLPNVINLCY